MDLFHSIESWVLEFGPSLWTLFFLFVFCVIDGFLPILPSETLIIALGALIVQGNGPNVYLLIITGALGAILGDQLAFGIGHRYNVERIRFLREGKGQVAVRFARKGLARRGPLYIIAARFIPIGRVAVNLIAGATGYPRHKFIPLTLLSGPIWSTYSAIIGIVSGHVFNGHPILSMLVGVSGGIALGGNFDDAQRGVKEIFGDAVPAPDDVQEGDRDDESKGDDVKARDLQNRDVRDSDVRDQASDARDEKDEAESAEMK